MANSFPKLKNNMLLLNKTSCIIWLLTQGISKATMPSQVVNEDNRYAYGQAIFDDVVANSEYYQSYFSNDRLYDSLTSLYNEQSTALFWNRWIQTTIADVEISMFSQLPSNKRSSLMESITSIYSDVLSEDSTISTWESPPVTPPSSTSWDTSVARASGVYSDIYNYAKCDAFYIDIHDYGDIYNNFFDTYTKTKDMSSFMTEYSRYISAANISDFDGACTSMISLISDLPWSQRILAGAKDLYKVYTTEYATIVTSSNSKYSTTTFTDTAVTITNQFESSVYDIAKWYAVLDDYANNVDQYTSLMSSYLDAESFTAQIDNFAQDILMINKTSGLNDGVYSSIYKDIQSIYTLFTWSDRLLYAAKEVYESYTSSYTLSSSSAAQTTLSITSSEAPSALPEYSPSIITATATESTQFTNTFAISVVSTETSTDSNSKETLIEHSIIETTITLVESVGNGSVYTQGAHSTLKITPDNVDFMYCGVDALLYDYQYNSDAYDSYINANKTELAVQEYLSAITKYSATNIFEDKSVYTKALNTLYNFVFSLPPEFGTRLYDILGYVYLDSLTQTTTDFSIKNYRNGSGQLFNDIFVYGGINSDGSYVFLTTDVATISGIVTSIETEVNASEAGEQVGLIIPTAIKLDLTATTTQDPEYFYITDMNTAVTHSLITALPS